MDDGYSVVELGHVDYEALMDINRFVYSGLDYLPAMFQSFLHNPNSRMFGVKRKRDDVNVSQQKINVCYYKKGMEIKIIHFRYDKWRRSQLSWNRSQLVGFVSRPCYLQNGKLVYQNSHFVILNSFCAYNM